MREILYRGKAINRHRGYHRTSYKNGEWVYGLVTRLYDERFENLPAEMRNTDGVGGIEIDYKTVGQYTGLTDKNGKEIFEGDVVKRCNDNCVVKWVEEDAEFGIFGGMTKLSFSLIFSDKLEIIGNIHDNPELLGDK